MHSIVTSFTRETIAHADAHLFAADVLSLALRNGRGRDDFRLIPLNDMLASNRRNKVKVIPLKGKKFSYQIGNNKRVQTTFDSLMAAEVAAWTENRKRNLQQKEAQNAANAKPKRRRMH